MDRAGDSLGNRTLRFLSKVIRLLLIVAIYALVLWYGAATAAQLDTPPIPTRIAVVLIAFGITGGIYRFLLDLANETKGGIMVLAAFLNEKLVEPQRRKLRAQGRAQGRAEAIADVRARLLQEGIDPDRIIPAEDVDDTDRS